MVAASPTIDRPRIEKVLILRLATLSLRIFDLTLAAIRFAALDTLVSGLVSSSLLMVHSALRVEIK